MRKFDRSMRTVVILAAVLIVAVAGLLTATALMPEFIPPEGNSNSVDRDAPIWNASYDDLIAYLQEKGFIGTKSDLLTEGVATEAKLYDNVEIYWWDVENLSEGSPEYDAWKSMQDEGYILLFGQYTFVPIMNGPFAISIHDTYKGDSKALRAAFEEFAGVDKNED